MVSPEKFTELLGQEHVFTILKLTDEPVSAAGIIKQSTVPQATCYRRIEELQEAGLLVEHGSERFRNGKETKKYVRTVESLHVEFDDKEVDISMEDTEIPVRENNNPEIPPQSPSIK